MAKPRLTAIRSTIQTAEAFIGLVDELCVNHHEYEPGMVESSTREDFINSSLYLAHGVYDVRPLQGELLPIVKLQADKQYAADAGAMLKHTLALHDFSGGYSAFSFSEDFSGLLPILNCFAIDQSGDEDQAAPTVFKDCIKHVRAARAGGRISLSSSQEPLN